MARALITKRAVDAAKPEAADKFIWDGEVSGFGLKITPAGSKVYVFQYRLARPGQAERTPAKRYTIGKHGNLTPDQARKRAKELAALVEQGIDPRQRELDAVAAKDDAERQAQEKARIEGELAFSRYSQRWLDHYEHEKARRPSSVKQAKLVVNRYLNSALGEKPMPYIGRADLQPILDAIPASRKGIRRAVFAYASVLFSWAAKRGDIARNPLSDMSKPEPPKSRDRVLTEDELAEVWRASQRLDGPFGTFYRLLILTGQRRDEVAAINWAELDRHTEAWTIPAGRAKNSTAHIVPLSPRVTREFDALANAGDHDEERTEGKNTWPKTGYVLTTTGRTSVSGFSKAKKSLDAAIKTARQEALKADNAPQEEIAKVKMMAKWRVHDLRRTLATGFQRLGIRFEVTEAVLNHVSGAKGGVAGVYQRHDWKDEKRSALNAWADYVSGLSAPKSADVIPIRRATEG